MPRRANQEIVPQIEEPLSTDDSEAPQRVLRRSTRIRRVIQTIAPYSVSNGTEKRRQVTRRTYTKKTIVTRSIEDNHEKEISDIEHTKNAKLQEVRNPLGLESEDVEPTNPAGGASVEQGKIPINVNTAEISDMNRHDKGEPNRSPRRSEGDESFPADDDIRVRDSCEDLTHSTRPDIPVE